jgi:hypothetical protein
MFLGSKFESPERDYHLAIEQLTDWLKRELQLMCLKHSE